MANANGQTALKVSLLSTRDVNGVTRVKLSNDIVLQNSLSIRL
jgi:hypothetical protein